MNDGYSVKFNGNDINQVQGVWLYDYTATNLPERDINIHKLARRSLSIVTSSEYTQKVIPVLMRVCSGDRQDTEATLTYIKGLLQAQNGTLEVLQSDDWYEYTATMNEFNIEWQRSTAYVQIIFLVSTPVAESKDESVLVSFNTTLPSDSAGFIVQGSYLSEPTINVVINSVTGGTGSISIINASTNQGITITDTFTASSELEINSNDYTVTLNGRNVDFQGIFPTFPPGAQRIGYSDTFSTRNVDVTVTANTRVV